MKAVGLILAFAVLAGMDALAAEGVAAPVVKTSLTELFDDPVLVRAKGVEIKRSQLEEAFISFRANLAARGQNLSEAQRATREAQLLDRLVITQILVSRASADDKQRAKELAGKFLEES